jgi:hypothetical protein
MQGKRQQGQQESARAAGDHSILAPRQFIQRAFADDRRDLPQ